MLTDEECLQFCYYYYMKRYKCCWDPEEESNACYELLNMMMRASSNFQIACLKAADNIAWGDNEVNLCCLFE